MAKTVISEGVTVTEVQELSGTDDILKVLGTLEVDGEEAAGNAVQVTGTSAKIINRGTIDGNFNSINFDNGGISSGQAINKGLITSEGRGINIGGTDISVKNFGTIETTENPRNGVIYSDQTAKSFSIFNGVDGVIDAGWENNGDAISLELGAEVDGTVTNKGTIQGRGVAEGEPNNQNNQSSAVRFYWGSESGSSVSVFNGNIKNFGTMSAENGAAILVEDQVQLNGEIINYGKIDGGANNEGQLGIDASKAEGNIYVRNLGAIAGDVLLSAGSDLYDGKEGEVKGTVAGGDGNDTIIGGEGEDMLVGDAGDDLIEGGSGSDTLVGGTGSDTFKFGSNLLQDCMQNPDVIEDFQSGDTFDFSEYLQTGGQIDFSTGQEELLIQLNGENSAIVRGDIQAAEQQLVDIVEW